MQGYGFLLRPCFRSIRIFFLLINLLAAISVHAQITFAKPDFDTGKGPVSVAVADFNRDGMLDVVTANATDNSITVLLNNGNGSFNRRRDYAAGKNPRAVATGDFNNDGIPDVAVANFDDATVSIFLGSSDGSLKPLSRIAVDAQPVALATGDFNRDGRLDLAVLTKGRSMVAIYLGRGDGSFIPKADYSVGPPSITLYFDSIATADFNGDGVIDMAVTNSSSQVFIFLGNGDGTFKTSNLDPDDLVGPVAVGDFNQDGKMDLAIQSLPSCRGCESNIVLFAGRGDGTFDQGHGVDIFTDDTTLIAADIRGRHIPDLVTPQFIVLTDPKTIFTDGSVPNFKVMPGAGLRMQAIAAGDFNGDGKLDLVTANFDDNTVSLLIGSGDGTFHQQLRYTPSGFFPDSIVSADFNGDGIPDLIVSQIIPPGFLLYIGNGDGTFRESGTFSQDFAFQRFETTDLNGDGIPDLVMVGFVPSGISGRFLVRSMLGKGDGTFAQPIDLDTSFRAFAGLAVADFNRDGVPDLAVVQLESGASRSFVLTIFTGDGDGSFRAASSVPIGSDASGIVVGDFDRDGIMDLAVGHASADPGTDVSILLGNGDATFRTGATYTVSGRVSPIASADLNGDSRLDLVVGNGQSITIFLGNGDGTFRQQPDLATFAGAAMIRVVDMNGDGFPDLVVADQRLSVFLNRGDGTFQSPLDFPTGGAQALAIADFNRDGKPDVAVINDINNASLSILLNGVSLTGRDFQLAVSTTSASVTPGQSVAMTVSVNGIGLFNDAVTFSCTGLPAGAACIFNPTSVTPGTNGSAATALTITTKAATTTGLLMHGSQRGALFAFGLPVMGIILSSFTGRGRWRVAVLLMLLVLCLFMLQGCAGLSASNIGKAGGNSPGAPGTPTGTYTVIVTGASGGSPMITHSLPLTLKVQ